MVGDARISLRQELNENRLGQRFDVLVLDAFNGDSLPLHLLTREAFALYLAHLDEQGILAIHASSRYFALEPVIVRQIEDLDLAGARIVNGRVGDYDDPSEWILVSRSRPLIERISRLAPTNAFSGQHRYLTAWTDDHSNSLQVVKAGSALPLLKWFARSP